MQIRQVAAADASAVSALWSDVFGYAEARNDPASVLAEKLRWDGRLLVAVEGERVIGTLMVGYDGHRGWLYRLAVAEEARRHGVGTALVREAERMLSALGCAKVNLQLHVDNDRAARFWHAVGYGREPRIDMGKDLTARASREDAGC